MELGIYIPASQVKDLIKAAYPDKSIKEVEVMVSETFFYRMNNPYFDIWEGNNPAIAKWVDGQWCACNLPNSVKFSSDKNDIDIKINSDEIILNLKNNRIKIYISPDSVYAPKMLPQEQVELTNDEKIVLVATRSLKSSYAGVPDYRFKEAKRETGITIERWNYAKDNLINKKYLDARGALTTNGKNAIDQADLKYKTLYDLQ